MPQVSVIIPNFNHSRYLQQRLDSVYGQTFHDIEVILLDDASTDDSVEVLKRYAGRPRTRLVVNERNSGSTFAQWNKGVALAEGEYIWIAESDDWADPAFLATLVPWMDEHPGAGLVQCDSYMADEAVKPPWARFSEVMAKSNPATIQSGSYICPGVEEIRRSMANYNRVVNASAVLFRKSAFEKVGGAKTKYRVLGDYILWFQIMEAFDYAYQDEPLNYFRTHQASVRKRKGGGLDYLEEEREAYRMASVYSPESPFWFWASRESLVKYLSRVAREERLDTGEIRSTLSFSGIEGGGLRDALLQKLYVDAFWGSDQDAGYYFRLIMSRAPWLLFRSAVFITLYQRLRGTISRQQADLPH